MCTELNYTAVDLFPCVYRPCATSRQYQYGRVHHGTAVYRSKFENILNLAAHTMVYTAVTPHTIVMLASVRISGDKT